MVIRFQVLNDECFIVYLMSALYSSQNTIQNYCQRSQKGWKDHYGPWQPEHSEEERPRQQNDLAWRWWHFKWEKFCTWSRNDQMFFFVCWLCFGCLYRWLSVKSTKKIKKRQKMLKCTSNSHVFSSIRWWRASSQQHFASFREIHHGAAGRAVLFPWLPASGLRHHHCQLISLQDWRTVQDHSCEQTLFPMSQVHWITNLNGSY